MLLEMDGGLGVPPVNFVVRKYTWGLDLAGLNGNQSRDRQGAGFLQTAGGVGGLLAMQDPNDPNDPNDPTGAIVAKYEYDPYGNIIAQSGSYAAENPLRFSTKYYDAETGLSDCGHRYYHTGLGRWLSRDPISEYGGPNLYGFAGNAPTNWVDYLGYMALTCEQLQERARSLGLPVTPNCRAEPSGHCPGRRQFRRDRGPRRWHAPDEPISPPPIFPPEGPQVSAKPPLPPCPPGQRRANLSNGVSGPCKTPNDSNAPTNGCTSSPDSPGGFPFGAACNEHDRCYATSGKSRAQCDKEFYHDMLTVCANSGYSAYDQHTCAVLAALYYDMVRNFGGPFYGPPAPPAAPALPGTPAQPHAPDVPCGPHY